MNPEFYKTINTFLEKRDKKEVVIMDIGCAEVRAYSEFLIKNSTKFIGLDKNEGLIKKAIDRFNSEKCEFLLLNIEDLKMPKGSFDIIVCNNMLAYTDQTAVLNIAYELLKDNGLLISYNNNTIEYSLYKIFHPYKPWHKELSHSIIVILNTWIFKLTGVRLFRTIYNTLPSLKKILDQNKYSVFYIKKEKTDLEYKVIDFYYIK